MRLIVPSGAAQSVGSEHDTAPAVTPSTIALVLEAIDVRYVAPSEPSGPSASAHSALPTVAPDSSAIACSTLLLTELSANTTFTPSCSIVSTSSARSPADACPWVESDGMTVPMTSSP